MLRNFDEIRERARELGPKRVAVAGGEGGPLAESLEKAEKLGLATAEIAPGPVEAVELVRSGRCDILMKGATDTGTFMKAVLDADHGLRGPGLMSHVFVTASRRLDRLLLVTDGGINLNPSLADKARIISNALPVARALGCEKPLVAVLAATEKVNSKMPETADAAELVEMNRRGEITGCTVAGPYAVDIAVSARAAARKGVSGLVAGRAEIILVPSVLVGNTFCKGITYLAGESCGGCVAGAAAPVVFLSRADDVETRLNSIALGVLTAGV